MADIEKVIKGLECCTGGCEYLDCKKDCGYFDGLLPRANHECLDKLMADALELLKEQVKTEVVFKEYDGILESECGNCGQHLDKAYSNCPKCNKALDWNKNQS